MLGDLEIKGDTWLLAIDEHVSPLDMLDFFHL